jgi:PPK2 family polyphosphate:nucleotide phosphotransferase
VRTDLRKQLASSQETLYADHRHAILVVLQAMDASGKDSTIRRCFGELNPQYCRTHRFKQPSMSEMDHDFLWRIHYRTPARGTMAILNRSHYESVLVEKVKHLAPDVLIGKRYDHINAFERMLTDEGTMVIKFYLHVSKRYQKQRLKRRLTRPDKQWKFSENDVRERALWDDYMRAYEEALTRCSTDHAPWYVIPSESRVFRDIIILKIMVDHLRSLDLKLPQLTIDPDSIDIPD